MLYPAHLRQILFCVAVIWSTEASAQTYPLRPITLVAPYAAGSGIDVMARKIRPIYRRGSASRSSLTTSLAPAALSAASSSPSRRPTATP